MSLARTRKAGSTDNTRAQLRSSNDLCYLEERFSAPFTWEIAQRVPPRSRALLDIGCGGGRLLRLLATQERELWGIDVERDKVHMGILNTSGAPGRIFLIKGNIFGHELPHNYFDTVVSSFALHDMAYAEAIEQITKVLKRAGEAILVDIERGYKPVRRARITEAWWAIKTYGLDVTTYWQTGEQTINEWLANCVSFYSTREMKAHINKPRSPMKSKEEVMRCWAKQYDVLESRDLWPGIYLLHFRRKRRRDRQNNYSIRLREERPYTCPTIIKKGVLVGKRRSSL